MSQRAVPSDPQPLVFYTTAGCHLCDQARAIYQHTLSLDLYQVEEVDIANDDQLIERYGVRIPVLKQTGSNRELGWPFDAQQLREFLGEGD